MGKNGADARPAPDPIDAAIAAADAPQKVEMQQINITISSTSRPVIIAIPTDISDSEIAEVGGWLLTTLMNAKRAERAQAAGPKLVIARGPLPPMPAN